MVVVFCLRYNKKIPRQELSLLPGYTSRLVLPLYAVAIASITTLLLHLPYGWKERPTVCVCYYVPIRTGRRPCCSSKCSTVRSSCHEGSWAWCPRALPTCWAPSVGCSPSLRSEPGHWR